MGEGLKDLSILWNDTVTLKACMRSYCYGYIPPAVKTHQSDSHQSDTTTLPFRGKSKAEEVPHVHDDIIH